MTDGTIRVMILITMMLTLGANMNKNIAKRCSVCNNESVKFMQNGLGYCGVSNALGYMNVFGFCKAKKKEAPELKKYAKVNPIY